MALSSAGMAGAGGGGMAINPNTAFGGNAMMAPQAFSSFEPPPAPAGAGDSGATGGSGAGGAYDLKGWENAEGPNEDMHACLGVDVSTSTIKACLYLDGCKKVGGKTPLPACILVDSKVGVKGVRRWLKQRSAGSTGPSAPPKGVTLFHDATAGGGKGGGSRGGTGKDAVVWPLRLIALKGKGGEAVERVRSSIRHEIKVSAEDSQEPDDAETSGVRVCLTSPDASEKKDKEVWCTAEEVLAMLLAGVKLKAQETNSVTVVTCNLSVPSCLGDLHRVALQRSVFLAGMIPGRFVGASLAATVGYLWGRPTPELKRPQDLIASVGMGSNFLDVAIMSAIREKSSSTGADVTPRSSGTAAGKKKKGKGGGAGGGVASKDSANEAVEYRVRGSSGDSACGGLDMDYKVARALLAVVEDSSGHEVAADRTLWYNLLDAAQLLRERLTSDPKSSFNLKAGSCDADPSFKHTVELSQNEMEAAVAGTIETVRKALGTAVDRAGATPGEVKTVVLHGLCTQTPAVYDEVLKAFPQAQISLADPGDCAKGAALLLAAQRSVLAGPPVKAFDAASHKLGLVDRSKKGAEPIELFAAGTSIPAFCDQDFSRKGGSTALAVDMEVVQWVEACGGGAGSGRRSGKGKKVPSNAARWVTVQRLGNPLAMQDDSGYPVLAEEVKLRFSLDDCGICVNEVQSFVLPKRKDGAGPIRRLLNQAGFALTVFGILGGGYWMLHRLEHAGERAQARARIRLTAFYAENNPEKLDTIEDTLQRYKGREDILFQRLNKQYGKPVPNG